MKFISAICMAMLGNPLLLQLSVSDTSFYISNICRKLIYYSALSLWEKNCYCEGKSHDWQNMCILDSLYSWHKYYMLRIWDLSPIMPYYVTESSVVRCDICETCHTWYMSPMLQYELPIYMYYMLHKQHISLLVTHTILSYFHMWSLWQVLIKLLPGNIGTGYNGTGKKGNGNKGTDKCGTGNKSKSKSGTGIICTGKSGTVIILPTFRFMLLLPVPLLFVP